jgi:hypothetical protein
VVVTAIPKSKACERFRSDNGDSFAFAGLVARIEVIRAFGFFAGLFFVRILLLLPGMKLSIGHAYNSGAMDKFLSRSR